jgi:hypothetical protein
MWLLLALHLPQPPPLLLLLLVVVVGIAVGLRW